MAKITALAALWWCALTAQAVTYYVDGNNGCDANSGLTPDCPWQSLERVNQTRLAGGDRILFAAGGVWSGQLRPQGGGLLADGKPLVAEMGRYGEGPRPRIEAQGLFQSALYLYNAEYWSIGGLELTNTGPERQAGRLGAHVHIRDFGVARHIRLHDLYIHDVNGSLVKNQGGGFGILWQHEGRATPSRFDGLYIENCHLVRCERDGIKGQGYTGRDQRWFPSLNVVIRGNLLEQIPGDGIVPLACDGALVEHNALRDGTRLLPEGEAAAGIWPWACDNTVIQYNEVSGHKAPWDAQGFDSDWNCTGTIIQYNYSHDNEGGFLLVCNNGGASRATAICADTIVRYNISVNDGFRTQGKHAGFSPTFHISGPVTNTRIYNNLIVVGPKPAGADRTLIKMDNWGGPWPRDTWFANNIFHVAGETNYDWGQSINHRFENNLYVGRHLNGPEDKGVQAAGAALGAGSYFYESRYPDTAAELNTLLPFTRNPTAHMDDTPVAVTARKHPRQTTAAHELATALVFNSAMSHYADSVDCLGGFPREAKAALREAPAGWDKTVCLMGGPGKAIVLARKTGTQWLVAGLNDTNTARPVALDLTQLGAIEEGIEIVEGQEPRMQFAVGTVSNSGNWQHTMPGLGGFVLMLQMAE